MLRIKSSIYLTGQVNHKFKFSMTETLGIEITVISASQLRFGIWNFGNWNLFVAAYLDNYIISEGYLHQ